MAFYDHFFKGNRTTPVTSAGDILNSPDNTTFIKDTGEIYTKSGNKLVKKQQFILDINDVSEQFLSKEDDDVFNCNWEPLNDNYSDIGTASKRLRNIYSVYFRGLATSADYADLAEKYSTDRKYPYGVVLQHAESGDHELELFNGGTIAGVISKNPAFLMNEASEGQYVALKGQTPVICKEDIKKGQYLIGQVGGYVKGVDKKDYTFEMSKDLVGVALRDSEFNYVLAKI